MKNIPRFDLASKINVLITLDYRDHLAKAFRVDMFMNYDS